MIAFAGAVLIRGLMLGWDNATGLSATYFPALIVATLYAGSAWGWGLLALVIALGDRRLPDGTCLALWSGIGQDTAP